jgi:hypothetical protein
LRQKTTTTPDSRQALQFNLKTSVQSTKINLNPSDDRAENNEYIEKNNKLLNIMFSSEG